MTEQRKYNRYACKLKSKFEYYEGVPEEIDIQISIPYKGKGFIIDISQGGVFMVSNERVTVGMPIRLNFSTKQGKHNLLGRIVRTGLLANNPSEVAQKFLKFSVKGDTYIAVEFSDPMEILSEKDV